jgi:hypothetical protein
MYPYGQGPSRSQIYQKLDAKRTDELLEIWRTNSREGRTGAAFEILEEILRKRLGSIPPGTPNSFPVTHSPRIPWILIILGIGVVIILAAVFSPLFLKPSALSTLTPSPTDTPTPIVIPTDSPTAMPSETLAATLLTGTSRPLTGLIMPNQSESGYGELTVENGTTRDGVVILTLNNVPMMAAYIRSGETFSMNGIRDGIYYLYFSTGDDWNGKVFTTAPSHKKFEDSFEFTTGATTYTTWSVTLQGVVGGTAAAEEIDESVFPSIGN